MNNFEIDKSQVALRFAQAGHSYAEHAVAQKEIAQHLFELMQQYCPKLQNHPVETVFEIGCGSGNLSHLMLENMQINHLVLNDLYAEIQQHFPLNPQIQCRLGDIEQLEFPQHIDLIASSSALQWVGNFAGIVEKAFQSLNQEAYFCFSTFGQQNLQEIKALTGQGLDYLDVDMLQAILSQNGFEILHLSEQTAALYFDHPKQVLQHLKATGVTATASHFRWTKQSLFDFYSAYQQFSLRDETGQMRYALTYHPIFCIARRMP